MPSPNIKKTQVGTYLPVDLYKALRKHSAESGVPIARLIEDAVRMLLKDRTGKEYKR